MRVYVSLRAPEVARAQGVGFFKRVIFTTIMELGPRNHGRDGLSVPKSIMVVYMDPLGSRVRAYPVKAVKPKDIAGA